MTTTKRTDIHAPASDDFDPQAYDFVGVFDLHARDGNRPALQRLLTSLERRGFHAAVVPDRGRAHAGRCTHCGASLRYTAVLLHMLTQEWIFVGEQCLGGRFEMSQAEFRLAREAALAARERRTRVERLAAFVAGRREPIVALLAATDTDDEIILASTFLSDLRFRLIRDCMLTDRQIEVAQRAYDRDAERAAAKARAAAERAARPAEYLGAVGEKITLTGEVVLAMTVDGYMPDTSQRLLVVQTDRGAAKVYTTARWAWDVDKGEQVSLTATVKRLDVYEGRPQTLITRAKKCQ